MLNLISSPTSPFVRKVRVVLAEKKIEYSSTEMSPWTAANPVDAFNPLGKVPVLVLDDGTHLYDSRVIVEYLDTVSPVSRLIPESGRSRIVVRRWEALADGIADAALALVLEGRRPEVQRSAEWTARQRRKVDAGVAELARELADKPWCNGDAFTLADIATGCTLGYLDFRHPGIGWRDAYPNLARLSEKLAKRPSFADTTIPPN